ncbi:hypothetical protein ACN20G_32465 (plasmid) [Streptomyces sp. BI20]|uniref:hypothetical protein n=1 Tax=Streptomyces sp. BI20 TaxID=3403460 RepID=UPI003C75B86D
MTVTHAPAPAIPAAAPATTPEAGVRLRRAGTALGLGACLFGGALPRPLLLAAGLILLGLTTGDRPEQHGPP